MRGSRPFADFTSCQRAEYVGTNDEIVDLAICESQCWAAAGDDAALDVSQDAGVGKAVWRVLPIRGPDEWSAARS